MQTVWDPHQRLHGGMPRVRRRGISGPPSPEGKGIRGAPGWGGATQPQRAQRRSNAIGFVNRDTCHGPSGYPPERNLRTITAPRTSGPLASWTTRSMGRRPKGVSMTTPPYDRGRRVAAR